MKLDRFISWLLHRGIKVLAVDWDRTLSQHGMRNSFAFITTPMSRLSDESRVALRDEFGSKNVTEFEQLVTQCVKHDIQVVIVSNNYAEKNKRFYCYFFFTICGRLLCSNNTPKSVWQ